MTDRTETKYGEMIKDHDWREPEDEEEQPARTRVRFHKIDVYYDNEPDPDDNYGRTRYIVRVRHEDGKSCVTHAIGHRWKGNYWRDTIDWDWRDLPAPVRKQIASILSVEGPDDLDCGHRLIDEGGESRFEKWHKPRIESMDGGEMWATSSLREAMKKCESAAEQLEGGSEDRADELVQTIQSFIQDLEEIDQEEAGKTRQ